MNTVSFEELKAGFYSYVADAEAGESFVILRDGKPVARLVPANGVKEKRPKVGETRGEQMDVPEDALRPMTEEELREWGL